MTLPRKDLSSLADHMVRDARTFYTHGWLMGTSGNLSCRIDAQTFLITASGKDKGALKPEDFLQCDMSGAPTAPTPHRPSAETLVHCEIYAHVQDAHAIYHVHDPFAALCSARDGARGTTLSGIEMIKGLDIWEEDAHITLPVLPNHAHIPDLAAAVRAHLLTREQSAWPVPCVNIARHGVYAWGRSPAEAKRHIETLHYLFHYSWQWELLGKD